MSKKSETTLLLLVMTVGLLFRIYGLNWDQGYHLHPDERAIIMISDRLHWPREGEWSKLFTPESSLNPKFFAYGSFPIYLLKLLGTLGSLIDKTLSGYDKINILGRVTSTIFDIGTIAVIYLLAKFLFKNSRTIPLLAALFYALSVLPIQLSHFFAVDTILNFFITLGIYLCVKYFERPSHKYLTALGIVSGLSFTTKFTGAFLLSPVLLTLLLISLKEGKSLSKGYIPFLFRFSFFTLIFTLSTFLTMPYVFIDFPTFATSISEQLRMAKDTYVFPFTLQYVNTLAYIYPLQQIFLWGLGPFISLLTGISFTTLMVKTSTTVHTMILRKKFRGEIFISGLIVGIFCLLYFLILGQSAVKFMRYYLPLYPILTILAAHFVDTFGGHVKYVLGQRGAEVNLVIIILVTFIWPFSFVSIYGKSNTRVTASEWINQNIKEGSVLAVEHWDDRLPLFGAEKFNFVEMPMYDPDNNEVKWKKISDNLRKADYIIVASNRLYTPLQKLIDCSKIKYEWRCYPKTAEYYQKLFSGELGFRKYIEITNYPKFPIFPAKVWPVSDGYFQFLIDDSSADENFTVFDHPKILIFKKM